MRTGASKRFALSSVVVPEHIAPFTVIRIPFTFPDQPGDEPKFFIVLGHFDGHAHCLKTTTQSRFYDSNPDAMAGCVVYEAGTVACFRKRTIIPSDSHFEIRHYKLAVDSSRGSLEVIGAMPPDFRGRLLQAIGNSETLDGRGKRWLGNALGIAL